MKHTDFIKSHNSPQKRDGKLLTLKVKASSSGPVLLAWPGSRDEGSPFAQEVPASECRREERVTVLVHLDNKTGSGQEQDGGCSSGQVGGAGDVIATGT